MQSKISFVNRKDLAADISGLFTIITFSGVFMSMFENEIYRRCTSVLKTFDKY